MTAPYFLKSNYQLNFNVDDTIQFGGGSIQLSNNNILVYWTDYDDVQTATSPGTDIVAIILDPLGNPLTANFQLNQHYKADHEFGAELAAFHDTGFVSVFTDYDEDDQSLRVRLETYTNDGTQAINKAIGTGSNAQVNINGNAQALVTWSGDGGVKGRVFTRFDNSLGDEFEINSLQDSTTTVRAWDTTTLSDGTFLTAAFFDPDTYVLGNNAMEFIIQNPDGTQSSEKLHYISDAPPNWASIYNVHLTGLDDGGYAMIFTETYNALQTLHYVSFTASGNVQQQGTLWENRGLSNSGSHFDIEATADGGFLVSWSERANDVQKVKKFADNGAPETNGELTIANSDGTTHLLQLSDGRIFSTSSQDRNGDAEIFGSIIETRSGIDIRSKATEGDDFLVGNGFSNTFYGNGGNDVMHGMQGNDFLFGRTGNDEIYGGEGDDRIDGNEGVDRLYGDLGDDILNGNDDADSLYGGRGNDTLDGGQGNDYLDGGLGTDFINGGMGYDVFQLPDYPSVLSGFVSEMDFSTNTYTFGYGPNNLNVETVLNVEAAIGGNRNDTIRGGGNADFLHGGDGNDRLIGSTNVESIYGGDGNDIISGGGGLDILGGGEGIDTLDYSDIQPSPGVLLSGYYEISLAGDQTAEFVAFRVGTYTVDEISEFENLIGTGFADILIGSDDGNTIRGGGGDDTIRGGLGFTDILYGEDGQDTIYGEGGPDQIIGGGDNDRLFGGEDNDFLAGGYGDDLLDGGTGADLLAGGWGNDDYIIDDEGDEILEDVGRGYDEVFTNLASYTLSDNLERLNFTDTGNHVGKGNALDNRFAGNAGNDRFVLDEGGADIFSGGNGFDTFDARDGLLGIRIDLSETYQTGTGDAQGDFFASIEQFWGSNTASDEMTGASGRTKFYGFGGSDNLSGGSSVDFLNGGTGDDELEGHAGRDTLQGERGDDLLVGGADRDLFLFVRSDFGNDTIFDYEDGLDRLKVWGGNDPSNGVADELSDFTITGNGSASVLLTLNDGTGDNSILLNSDNGQNITIDASDFLFY
ncbi:calcium-binding protein [Pseudahrensia aquimaris]|uniref:Calcium-binding protein n=1 Tax=Pseudahrensia aquimaris TaxID=744461 RepID=A0ABW3FH11_9HYPH